MQGSKRIYATQSDALLKLTPFQITDCLNIFIDTRSTFLMKDAANMKMKECFINIIISYVVLNSNRLFRAITNDCVHHFKLVQLLQLFSLTILRSTCRPNPYISPCRAFPTCIPSCRFHTISNCVT